MAIFKNYYNRKPLGYIHKWCITVSCLMYLLSGRAEFAVAARRHVAKGPALPPGDLNHHPLSSTLDQIERNFVSETPPPPQQQSVQQQQQTQPLTVCPNCLYKSSHHHHNHKEVKSETDTLRLEAIKTQILSKLGLRHKPNVSHAFPREVIMETLYRAEDDIGDYMPLRNSASSSSFSSSTNPDRHHLHHHHESSTDREETVDVDDFYGRTSKIISFAEQGYRVNGNRLLEFRVSTESGLAGQKFKVVAATLWLKADIRHPPSPKCKSTNVYVFNFVSSLKRSIKVNSKEFRELTEEPVATSLENPGWQKIDLTVTVRQWLEGRARESLRLFVDCSCCSNWDVHVFNGDGDRRSDSWNRPFLVVHTDPATAKRVKRRALDCSPDSGSQCCKQRFYVSFRELGWDDWIIAPKGYFANYCRGDCGHHRTPDSFVTYHTHVIEEVRKTHHLSGMQPCCAPLKFSSMSLIYFGPDSNIIKRDLPKMVVDECGCP